MESAEDLQYELNRIKQKYQILERNYNILVEEKSIQESSSRPDQQIFLLEKQLVDVKTELSNSYAANEVLKNKLVLVKRCIHIQQRDLASLKQESSKELQDMLSWHKKHAGIMMQKVVSMQRSFNLNLDDSRESLAKSMVEIEQLTHENAKLKETNNQQKSALAATMRSSAEERQQMQLRFTELCTKIEGLQSVHNDTVAHLTTKLQSLATEHEALLHENKQLQSRIDRSADENSHLSKRIAELESTNQQLTSANQQLTSTLVGKQSLEQSAEDRLRHLQKQYDSSMELLSTLQSDLDLAHKTEARLRNELQSNGGEKGELSRKLAAIQQKVSEIESTHEKEMESLTKRLNASEQEALSRKMELNAVVVSKQELESRVGQLSKTLAAAEERAAAADKARAADKSASDAQQAQLQATCANLRQTEAQLRDDKQQMEDIIDNLKEEIQALKKEGVDLKTTHIAKEEQLSSKIRALEVELSKVTALKSKADVDQLTAQLAAKDVEIEGLKETIKRECEERTMMLISMSELKDQLLLQRSQQHNHNQQIHQSASVGTKDHRVDASRASVSQSFLDSLVHTIGNTTPAPPNSNNNGRVTFPALVPSSSSSAAAAASQKENARQQTAVTAADVEEDDEPIPPGNAAAWKSFRDRPKKNRKMQSSGR